MLIETRELTTANVNLGAVNELSALMLFADVYLHRLGLNTGVLPTEMTDVGGNKIYPGVFWSHLTAPPTRRLEQYKLWDQVSVAVDISCFGGMILDSTYVLARPGEVSEQRETWLLDQLPSMRLGSMFVVEESRESEARACAPKEGMVAQLPRIPQPPAAIQEFTNVQKQGSIDPGFRGAIRSADPMEYELTLYRDIYPGHGVMFATYSQIMDLLERQLMSQHAFPPVPAALMERLSLLEREMYYFGNCHQPGVLRGYVTATISSISSCSATLYEGAEDLAAGGIVTSVGELYEAATGRLLVVSKAKKLLAIPAWKKTLLREADRIVAAHAG